MGMVTMDEFTSRQGDRDQTNASQADTSDPLGGLWAFHKLRFYGLVLHGQNRHMDHVRWFEELGLPDHGPEFDTVLRGRMTWDWHAHYFVLSYYGESKLPNRVYHQVNRFFNKAGHRVVERPVNELWQ